MIIHPHKGLSALRRRLGRLIPLVAVVVLVQLLAPIGAVRFIASAIADPVGVAPLCAEMARPGQASHAALPSGHDSGCCAICAVGLNGAPVPALPPQDFVVARFAEEVVWHLAEPSVIDRRSFVDAQARGPPALVPVSA